MKLSNRDFVKQTQDERKNPITNRGRGSNTPPETFGKKAYLKKMDQDVAERAKGNKSSSKFQDIAENYRRKYNIAAKDNNFIGAGSALAMVDAANRAEKARKGVPSPKVVSVPSKTKRSGFKGK